jgi:hypothetical protein
MAFLWWSIPGKSVLPPRWARSAELWPGLALGAAARPASGDGEPIGDVLRKAASIGSAKTDRMLA